MNEDEDFENDDDDLFGNIDMDADSNASFDPDAVDEIPEDKINQEEGKQEEWLPQERQNLINEEYEKIKRPKICKSNMKGAYIFDTV